MRSSLLVRHGKSSKHIVRRARAYLLLRSGAQITGIVLNAVDMSSPEYYGYYGYSGYSYSSIDSRELGVGRLPPVDRKRKAEETER